MNNKTLWIVGLVVVVAVGGYLLMSNKKAGYETANTDGAVKDSSKSADSADHQEASLKELLAMGSTQKCTFKTDESEGSFYVSEGKARGDFQSTVDNVTTAGHMIVDKTSSHVWMDGQPKGFKVSMENLETPKADANLPEAYKVGSVDYNEKVDYHCEKWTPDSSMFTLPSGVEFMDMSALLESSGKMMENAQNMNNAKAMEDAMKQMQEKMGQ